MRRAELRCLQGLSGGAAVERRRLLRGGWREAAVVDVGGLWRVPQLLNARLSTLLAPQIRKLYGYDHSTAWMVSDRGTVS